MTGIEHQIDFITLLLKVLAVLLGVIATGFGWWWATGLSKDVKALIIQKLDCNTQYANKNDNAESHHRIWNKLENHDKELTALKADVSRSREKAAPEFIRMIQFSLKLDRKGGSLGASQ